MPRPRSRLPLLALAATAVLCLSACGGTPAAAPGSAAPSVAAPTPDIGTVLSANITDRLGTVVVDGQGFTLYRFDKDTTKPPASNCADACAQQWPPVLATPGTPLTVEGVSQEAVGTINRPDGTIQLTLGGWPVYRYSGDAKPGAVSGQGLNGTWAAVRPDGGKAASEENAAPDAKAPAAGKAPADGTKAGDDAEPAPSGY